MLCGRRWKTLTGFGSLSLDNAGLKASRERGDGAPPPPRPGSMVGHTGPSSVIGSNKGWLRCRYAGRGKSRVSSPRRSTGVSGSPPVSRSREWRAAQFYLMKRTESRGGLGYGRPRSAPWDESSERSHRDNYGPGRLPSPGESGKGTRDPWDEEMATFACAAGLRGGRWDGLGR